MNVIIDFIYRSYFCKKNITSFFESIFYIKIKIMSFNIISIIKSFFEEPDKLSKNEMVDLYILFTGDKTMLTKVIIFCKYLQTNCTKFKYLRGLLKKSKFEFDMFICFFFSAIFANNTKYLLNFVLFFFAFYCQILHKKIYSHYHKII